MKKLIAAFLILITAMAIVVTIGIVVLLREGKSDDAVVVRESSESVSVLEKTMSSVTRSIIYKKEDESDKIPDGYIAILKGGTGEITYDTYVYQTVDGFEYINTTRKTISWGSPQGKVTIDSQGVENDIDHLLEIADDHNSANFVIFPGDKTSSSIEDFKEAYG